MTPEVTLTGAVIAVVQFIKSLPVGESIKGWVTIAIAAILGLLAGLAHFQGMDWFAGLLAGLFAVGTMTGLQAIGLAKTTKPE